MRALLRPGDPAPWFVAANTSSAKYHFHTAAGRYVLLCFFGSTRHRLADQALRAVMANRALFDEEKVAFFGVTIDPQDKAEGRLRPMLPGIRFFWDFDRAVSRLFGALDDGAAGSSVSYRGFWLLLDPMLRVMTAMPFAESEAMMRQIAALPPVARHAGTETPAPVLVLPRVFEPEFCRHLIGLYEAHGGTESGFLSVIDGKIVDVLDHEFKRRSDYVIADEATRTAANARLGQRLMPEIFKVFHYQATRIERFIVACYDGKDGGFFRAHRDNSPKDESHRRFAVTLNLNDDFDGGELRFPEFGPLTYRAPTGGAVVFCCSLLHEATPVTRGRRYAFLPFLYDEEAEKTRLANEGRIVGGPGDYRQVLSQLP